MTAGSGGTMQRVAGSTASDWSGKRQKRIERLQDGVRRL